MQLMLSIVGMLILPACVKYPVSHHKWDGEHNLVTTHTWFVDGPIIENKNVINRERIARKSVRITANHSPQGEIELNVPIKPSSLNDGLPIKLPAQSKYVEITYRSTDAMKLQAREGNATGTGCMHGGSHPMSTIPASPQRFTTVKLYWKDFYQYGLSTSRVLDTHDLCKLNFVNYKPTSGSVFEITSLKFVR